MCVLCFCRYLSSSLMLPFCQFGLTSIFYNVALSFYFLLVIVRSYRDSQLQKIRLWLIGVPFVVGTVLALASIPYIWPVGYACHISPPVEHRPDSPDTWGPFLGLLLVPGLVAVTITTGVMLRVYWHIRGLNQKSRQWQFGDQRSTSQTAGSSPAARISSLCRSVRASLGRLQRSSRSGTDQLQKEVFWQAMSYLVALYVAWILLLVMVSVLPCLLFWERASTS
mmetsp:Transcript_9665/g.16084  ORF Transcript_9665/g.16084 Transcript_9665/m.16084 type:complete len:224 (-) Transcript_9665:114-785(-)